MSQKKPLIDRLHPGPRPVDDDNAARLIAEFQTAMKDVGADDLADRIGDDANLRTFFAGVLEGSGYLNTLLLRMPDLTRDTLIAEPDERFASLLINASRACRDCGEITDAMRVLRQLKEAAALLISLCDLGGVWSVDDVTNALSSLAEMTLNCAVDWLLVRSANKGQLTLADPESPSSDSGLIILGMGKLGAGELNFSSDIDIIVFYDPDIAPLADNVEPSAFFTRLVKDLVRLMHERTKDGYVFRTDLRLRPDPGATAPAINVYAALQYYESLAQNWERAAMIKARPIAGDRAAGAAFLSEITPFVWRKHMDFAALADVHAMKRQIHAHKGHGRLAIAGHNVKLGKGGIREIEFFVQTQQLIAGGRNPALRCRRTLEALDHLTEAGWLTAAARDEQAAAYRFLRWIEHRIQMVADEQTHDLPAGDDDMARFARFCGFEDRTAFDAAMMTHMTRVTHHYAHLFEDAPELSNAAGNLVFTGDDDDPETLETLSRMGFEGAHTICDTIRAWHFGRFNATRSTKAREALTEITPALLEALSQSGKPDAGFLAFDRFVRGLPAGVQLFSMLRSNPQLLDLLVTIMGTAPRLADIVSLRPQTLEAMLEPGFFDLPPDTHEVAVACDAVLSTARDYEDFLDRARIFGQGQAFLVGVRVLNGNLPATAAGEAYAALADLLIERLAARAFAEIAAQHGQVAGAEYAIVAMGRLGSREMTATSDLDLIVVYDHDEDAEASQGGRSISSAQYFTRFTQRFVAALSAPTAEGTLYEVDMRLRPSGRKGPVATRLASFTEYQLGEAWTWEHMALTRARVIAGSPGLTARVAAVRQQILDLSRDPAKLRQDIASMRARIEAEKAYGGVWDVKLAPGGLVDIEFITQFLELSGGDAGTAISTFDKLRHLAQVGGKPAEEAQILLQALQRYQGLLQLLRLCLTGKFDSQAAPHGLAHRIAASMGEPDLIRVEASLRDMQSAVRDIFERWIGPVTQSAKADA